MNDNEEVAKYKKEWKLTGKVFKKIERFLNETSVSNLVLLIVVAFIDVFGVLIFFLDDYQLAIQQIFEHQYLEGALGFIVSSLLSGHFIAVPLVIWFVIILAKRKIKQQI